MEGPMRPIRNISVSLLASCTSLAFLGCGTDRQLPLESRAERAVAGVSAQVSGGGGPWSAFGDAAAVRQEVGTNPWAVQLRSEASGFGGVAFEPRTPLTFAQVTALSADFNVT